MERFCHTDKQTRQAQNLSSFANVVGKQDSINIHLKPTLHTVKILKIGTPEIITIIVLQLEQLDFTVQYCVQKMQTE